MAAVFFSENGIERDDHAASHAGPGASPPTAPARGRVFEIIAALSLFVAFYLATFVGIGYLAAPFHGDLNQWIALISVCVASAATIAIFEHGSWELGLFVAPRLALREVLLGCAAAALLIGGADGLVMLTTRLRHAPGNGFPWLELVAVYLPAAFHEELLFRGYAFQKLWRTNRPASVLFSSIVFAGLHAGNNAVSVLALANLFFAGLLLALAYARYERLWFPIGIHLAWNLLSGPILGYNVSGYVSEKSLFLTVGGGPVWLTGGRFGIEGSIWIVVVELAAIALLLRQRRNL